MDLHLLRAGSLLLCGHMDKKKYRPILHHFLCDLLWSYTHLARMARTTFHISAHPVFYLFHISGNGICYQQTPWELSSIWPMGILWFLAFDHWHLPVQLEHRRVCQPAKQSVHQWAV